MVFVGREQQQQHQQKQEQQKPTQINDKMTMDRYRNKNHTTTEYKMPSTNRIYSRNRQHHPHWPLSWIIFMVSMSAVAPEMIYRVDPLGKYIFIGLLYSSFCSFFLLPSSAFGTNEEDIRTKLHLVL